MKNYLSFGGGVNSVAMHLLMLDQGVDFDAVFVHHGTDWPETYEYVDYFIGTGRPVTVIKPDIEGFDSLVKYLQHHRMIPSMMQRFCTDKFKVRPLHKYCEPPCFQHIGIDAGESHRAKIATKGDIEYRYMLVENNINRDGCVRLIEDAGLIVPPKSGCYFCPFQRVGQWRRLRREKPELFCTAQKMEESVNEARREIGQEPVYFSSKRVPIKDAVIGNRDKQKALPGMEDLEYPPCQCGL